MKNAYFFDRIFTIDQGKRPASAEELVSGCQFGSINDELRGRLNKLSLGALFHTTFILVGFMPRTPVELALSLLQGGFLRGAEMADLADLLFFCLGFPKIQVRWNIFATAHDEHPTIPMLTRMPMRPGIGKAGEDGGYGGYGGYVRSLAAVLPGYVGENDRFLVGLNL